SEKKKFNFFFGVEEKARLDFFQWDLWGILLNINISDRLFIAIPIKKENNVFLRKEPTWGRLQYWSCFRAQDFFSVKFDSLDSSANTVGVIKRVFCFQREN